MGALSRAAYHEAVHYADVLGVEVPHTVVTVKPSGSVSKLFGLTEGWHLPSMLRYLRWVQFRNDDPLIKTYSDLGYPIKELQTYKGHTIVGFPTVPTISLLEGIEDHLVTAGEASMEDQFEWLRLGERFWIEGYDVDAHLADMKLLPDYGNQISYTLKYQSEVTGFDLFKQMLETKLPTVRCVSVMPQDDGNSAYEYLPRSFVCMIVGPAQSQHKRRLDTRCPMQIGINRWAESVSICQVALLANGRSCVVTFNTQRGATIDGYAAALAGKNGRSLVTI
ncbi:MAG: hypothetical protein EON58_06495 [Alphaproteobacteria bacterium]|nr:MAG: hypothetical protein EON58_06495 [Alphaproteobacteria bacterium]